MQPSLDYESGPLKAWVRISAILIRKSEVCSYWNIWSSTASHGPLLHMIELNKTEHVVFISLLHCFFQRTFFLN